jgi:adenylosuccinate lyase
MIERYRDKDIDEIWSDKQKLILWQKTELAVLKARVKMKELSLFDFNKIAEILNEKPIEIDWWEKRDKEIHHDLKAFIDERVRFLPEDLKKHVHKKITSFDTEEPAFAGMLLKSCELVEELFVSLRVILEEQARRYRYTVMNGRTHGQEAELQTFGKRFLTWIADLQLDFCNLMDAKKRIRKSKLSGAIGNYVGVDPGLEKQALKVLGLEPYYGSTQIMPRENYAPLAEALCQITLTISKIAKAIRLGARSGRPICQEPFGKKQKGSSTMPHKKNTIRTEQLEGMARMAKGYLQMIMDNIETWEERAIEQSCVERIAWPDLFHVTVRSLKVITAVIKGLQVYPDNMLLEIIDSRGCYASSEAKETLQKLGLSRDDSYNIVQLAAFNAFEVRQGRKSMRENPPKSFEPTDILLSEFSQESKITDENRKSIKEIISKGKLKFSSELEFSQKEIEKWNKNLKGIFEKQKNLKQWNQIFLPSYLLRNEKRLYEEILNL